MSGRRGTRSADCGFVGVEGMGKKTWSMEAGAGGEAGEEDEWKPCMSGLRRGEGAAGVGRVGVADVLEERVMSWATRRSASWLGVSWVEEGRWWWWWKCAYLCF